MSNRAIGNNGAQKVQGVVNTIGAYLNIFQGHKIAALLVWLASAYATSILIEDVRSPGRDLGGILDGLVLSLWGSAFLSAIAMQFVLTVAEQSIWRRKQWNIVSTIAMCIDVAINAAAIWPFVRVLNSSSLWTFATQWLSMSPEYSNFTAGIVTIIGGVLLAAAPEYLWRGE